MKAQRRAPIVAALPVVVWLGVFAPGSSVAETATNVLLHSVSVSRQFVAYAPQPLMPPALCVAAEGVKRAWLARLNATDTWRDPIVLVVRQRQAAEADAAAIALDVFRTDLHLKYQIRCLVPPPLDETSLFTAIVEMLCAEFANRSQPIPRSGPYEPAPIPPWLVHGLTASIAGRPDLMLSVARRSVLAGRPQTAAELLATTRLPTEPLARQLFQANSWLLTESLLALPSGPGKLRQFLIELGSQRSAERAFRTVYRDDFAEDVLLEKWWAVQLARRAAVVAAQSLSAEETTVQLDEILSTTLTRVSAKKGVTRATDVPVDKLWLHHEQPWAKDALTAKLVRLNALQSQAHPRYRAVIGEYIRAIQWLADQKINRFRRSLRKAEQSRAAADEQSHKISAYLDQAERRHDAAEGLATQFSGYFRTLDQFQAIQQQRRNPISDHLDRFDH